MPGIDELPADQRAVLQLLLRRRRSYADIATALRLDEDAVRRRAHAAVDALGPATTAPPARRAAAADWLLGQRDDAPGDLAAGGGTRAWATALRERLAPLAEHDLPELPASAGAPAQASVSADEPAEPAAPADPTPTLAARAAASAAPVASPAAVEAAAASAEEHGAPTDANPAGSPARPRSSRRGGAILLGGLALVAVVAVAIFVLTRSGDDSRGAAAPATTQRTSTTDQNGTRVLAQVNLKAPKGAPNRKAIGVVQIARVNGNQSLVAVAQGLKVTKDASWGIWAEGGPGGRRWLGPFSQGDAQGRVYAQGRLEPGMDILRYERLVVSRDSAKTPPKTQGTPYLAGTITAPKQR